VREVLVAPEDPAAVLAADGGSGNRIVTLTITEKGYCHEPATGGAEPGSPDIVTTSPTNPHPESRPPGFLVRAFERRRAAGSALHRPDLRQPPGERQALCAAS
jgi:fructuronate reductase